MLQYVASPMRQGQPQALPWLFTRSSSVILNKSINLACQAKYEAATNRLTARRPIGPLPGFSRRKRLKQ
jgi:hypothetical protein